FSFGDWKNPSSVQLINELSRSFPLLSLSFASDDVSTLAAQGVNRLFSFLAKARTGDSNHALQQARLLTETVLSPETKGTRAFTQPIIPSLDGLLVCHTPLPLDRHFADFSKEYQRSLEAGYVHLPVVTVSGNGTPYPEYPHRDFLTQATVFYPLGKV